MIKIELTNEQEKKFEQWKETFNPLPYLGTTGGHFGLKIIFTSTGDIVKGINWKGDEIDLTDYDEF